MVLDEHELRERLAVAADLASAPRFTADDLTGRIRRRRAKIAGLVSGLLLAMAAAAVAVPVALTGPGTAPESRPAVVPFQLSFTIVVNGRPRAFPRHGVPPSFTVTPGEHLNIRVGVIVPAHARVSTLWLGISGGEFTAPGRDGRRPASMRPVLAHTRGPLMTGRHTFRLTWTMPTGLPSGTALWLVTGWTTKQGYASVGQGLAELVTRR
jgi:hypothetical protein